MERWKVFSLSFKLEEKSIVLWVKKTVKRLQMTTGQVAGVARFLGS
jgi:hypothetical protein